MPLANGDDERRKEPHTRWCLDSDLNPFLDVGGKPHGRRTYLETVSLRNCISGSARNFARERRRVVSTIPCNWEQTPQLLRNPATGMDHVLSHKSNLISAPQ